jgi:hypothetical protein
MLKAPLALIPLKHDGDNKYLFDSVQFPIGYAFGQNKDTGVIDRSFTEATFMGDPVSCR